LGLPLLLDLLLGQLWLRYLLWRSLRLRYRFQRRR
jgi:hypothetical protein